MLACVTYVPGRSGDRYQRAEALLYTVTVVHRFLPLPPFRPPPWPPLSNVH
jgi:hypothetical protein